MQNGQIYRQKIYDWLLGWWELTAKLYGICFGWGDKNVLDKKQFLVFRLFTGYSCDSCTINGDSCAILWLTWKPLNCILSVNCKAGELYLNMPLFFFFKPSVRAVRTLHSATPHSERKIHGMVENLMFQKVKHSESWPLQFPTASGYCAVHLVFVCFSF